MSGYFYAIGGANYDKKESLTIDLDIIKESGKTNPNLLYVPVALNDDENKINSFLTYYKELGAKVDVLYSVNVDLDKEIIVDKFSKSDIIYLSGGMTSRLVSFCQTYDLKEAFFKAFDEGKIIVGVSAGAISFFEYGFGDKEAYTYNLESVNHKMTNGLGLFKGIFCPHYQNSGLLSFHDEVKKFDVDAFALENGAALKINKRGFIVVKNKGCNAFSFIYEEQHKLNYLKEQQLFKVDLFK